MKKTTIDLVRTALPQLDELRPVLDRVVAQSVPDEERTWAGSGALASVGERLVDAPGLTGAVDELVEREADHLRTLYEVAAEAVAAVAEGDPATAARTFLRAFSLEEARDRPAQAEAWADAAVRSAEAGADEALRSLALRRRGRARRACARYREGEQDYERAFSISRAIGDRQGAAEAAIGTGNLVEDEARWDEAEQWYRRALEALEELEQPTSEHWHAWLNIHVVQRARGELEASVLPLREAERIADAVGDDGARMFLENALGQWHAAMGSFIDAERHLRDALDVAYGSRARVTIRLNLADVLLRAGRRLDAVEQARRAEREAIVGHAFGELPEVYRLLGRAASEEGNPDAFVLFERALALVDERGLPVIERARTLEAYARAERHGGQGESADRLLDEARSLYTKLGVHPPGDTDPDGASQARRR